MEPPWFQECIHWIMLFDDMYCSHSFFLWWCHYFKGIFEVFHMSKKQFLFYNTCCSHRLQQAVCGWFELERYVQVQLFTKYSKFFRRAIVKICFCKGEFSICNLYTYFLRNSCSFGVLIVLIFFWGMQFWGTSTLQLHSLELVIWNRQLLTAATY